MGSLVSKIFGFLGISGEKPESENDRSGNMQFLDIGESVAKVVRELNDKDIYNEYLRQIGAVEHAASDNAENLDH
ncbi:MAG: hypothetical protein AAFW84_26245 [Cyanobacteria bacterium J06635_15]